MTAVYSALILSLLGCLIALAIVTASLHDKPASPMPVGNPISPAPAASGR
jgi:hypothetical protein